MPVYKCHNCGSKTTTDSHMKEFVCSVCGAVNVVPVVDEASDEPLGCLAPTGFEWKMPAGVIGNPVVGYTYVTAQGTHMSREEYKRTFGIDPVIALEYMRKNKGVKFGRQA